MKQTIIEKAIKSIKDLQNSTHSSSQKLGLAQAMDILEDCKVLENQHQEYSEEDLKEAYKKGYANGQMDAFIN